MTVTTTVKQEGQSVEDQVIIGGSATIGQIGDNVHINLPPQIAEVLLAFFKQDEGEDLTLTHLKVGEWEPETILVPAGSFLMGNQPGEGVPDYETPQFELSLPSYRMGKFPVTNGQYAYFMRETEQSAWLELGWGNGNQPTDEQNNLPVKGVTWYGALAYCLWLIEKTGRPYTLPSEAQWEKAARGTTGKRFPWGDDWQSGQLCNTDCRRVTAVNTYPNGLSEYGCYDMVGNVREWTTTLWGRNRRYNLDLRNPYPQTKKWESVNELKENQQIRRVTRGGASLVSDIELRAARRQPELPYRCGLTNNRVGFRVALNMEGDT